MEASSDAVTTQVYCDCVPFSAPTICGSATDTIVPLIIATNRTSSSPLKASMIWRWDIGSAPGLAPELVFAAVGALTRSLP
ncbi:hypothetical protein GCM10022419_026570 [Nonomuraea rosea]|uniref:Uncharacterized protein n=1 Tax=Nonomuraea rosea TaxID=638574 RepID=A0ABP6W293_9ACTN